MSKYVIFSSSARFGVMKEVECDSFLHASIMVFILAELLGQYGDYVVEVIDKDMSKVVMGISEPDERNLDLININ